MIRANDLLAVGSIDAAGAPWAVRLASVLLDRAVLEAVHALPRLRDRWEDLLVALEVWWSFGDDYPDNPPEAETRQDAEMLLEEHREGAEVVREAAHALTRAAGC